MAEEATAPPAPLAGLVVLEFTQTVMGPSAGMVLADLGADVIKIEPAPAGDPTRRLTGFAAGFFGYFNRNKRSLAVDLKSLEGRDIVHRLAAGADVVVENFAPGTMARLGCGYETLSVLNPRLVYCELKGFLSGPGESDPALDEVMQYRGGLAYMTGPPGRPLRAGTSIVDIMGGVFGVVAILAALRERDCPGCGQLVRSALFESAVFLMGQHMAAGAILGQPMPPMPERRGTWGVYQTFDTEDGHQVFVAVTSDAQWERFCRAFDRPELLADARLRTNQDRADANPWLVPLLADLLRGFARDEVFARCRQAAVPCAPVARVEDLYADPHIVGGGGLLETLLPGGGTSSLPRLPVELDRVKPGLRRQAPRLGEHTREILCAAGFAQDAIATLAQRGLIAVDVE